MQWIFGILGLLVGALAGESITGAILGGLLGMVLGQQINLADLQARNKALRSDLQAFAQRFEAGTDALYQRLLRLERESQAKPSESAVEPVQTKPQAVNEELTQAHEPAAKAEAELPLDLDWQIELPESPQAAQVAEEVSLDSAFEGLAKDSTPGPITPVTSASIDAPSQPSLEPAAQQPSSAPQPQQQPDWPERAFAAARDWLLGGNTVVRLAVLVLFLGLAFLLRYATEGMVLPPQGPYLLSASAAVTLLGLGWWLRLRRPAYALVLQGTGIAVLYLTVFAAIKLYPTMHNGEVLISPQAGFFLLVAVTLFSAMLAILQDALGLAAAAALGGFAAPILASTGGGNHVALFSYFTLLNLGIFAIAWFKAWRLLNLIGFFGTFGIGLAWGLRSYQPELFASTEPFLLVFFAIYLAIALLFARRRLQEATGEPEDASREALLRWSRRQTHYVDGTLFFCTPLVGFASQYAVIRHIEFGASFSALLLGLLYMLLARVLASRTSARALLLVESCMALGVVFGTLAIPLGLDAQWTSAAWAVEAAGIYWLGLRQRRPLARIFALLLQMAAALAFLADVQPFPLSSTLLDGSPLGALMLGAALLFSFWQLRLSDAQQLPAWEIKVQPVLAVLGLAFLYLIAPLCFWVNGTVVAWTAAGLLSLQAALRLHSRSILVCAFAVQLFAAILFMLHLQISETGSSVLDSGWRGLVIASLMGLALVASVLMASTHSLVQNERRITLGLSVMLVCGLALINLAVLFVLPWRSIAAVWSGTGLLTLWLGLQLRSQVAFAFGLVLQLCGALAFLLGGLLFADMPSIGLRPLAHMGFWSPALLALAAFLGAWRLQRTNQQERSLALGGLGLTHLSQLLLLWGAGWWAMTVIWEASRFLPSVQREHFAVLVAAASTALWTWIARRESWRDLALLCLALLPASVMALLSAWHSDYQPLGEFGWLAWPALLVVHWLALRRLSELLPNLALRAAHVLGCWLLLAVLALEARYLLLALAEQHNAWRWLGWALVPSLYLLLMAHLQRWPWPVSAYPLEYRAIVGVPLAIVLIGWFWLVNLSSNGSAEPLPYLPLLNPLEVGMLIVLLAVLRWSDQLSQLGFAKELLQKARLVLFGTSLFALLSLAVCRTVHHWFGVPFEAAALYESMQVQTGWSIVWTLMALSLMIFGHLRMRRVFWQVGAVLLAIVVVKLFLIDRSNSGGLERIISFLVVGVLMLIIGYFAPMPPRQSVAKQE